jgi:hypothetical protein
MARHTNGTLESSCLCRQRLCTQIGQTVVSTPPILGHPCLFYEPTGQQAVQRSVQSSGTHRRVFSSLLHDCVAVLLPVRKGQQNGKNGWSQRRGDGLGRNCSCGHEGFIYPLRIYRQQILDIPPVRQTKRTDNGNCRSLRDDNAKDFRWGWAWGRRL